MSSSELEMKARLKFNLFYFWPNEENLILFNFYKKFYFFLLLN